MNLVLNNHSSQIIDETESYCFLKRFHRSQIQLEVSWIILKIAVPDRFSKIMNVP
jgi:hypothetical protein